jgi:hypothetical protein
MHAPTQFCNHGIDTARRNPVKVVKHVRVSELEDGVVRVEVRVGSTP